LFFSGRDSGEFIDLKLVLFRKGFWGIGEFIALKLVLFNIANNQIPKLRVRIEVYSKDSTFAIIHLRCWHYFI